jgi:hypothetical protein
VAAGTFRAVVAVALTGDAPTTTMSSTASILTAQPPSEEAQNTASHDGKKMSTRVKHEKLLVLDLNGLFIDRLMKRHVKVEDADCMSDKVTAKKRARDDAVSDDEELAAPSATVDHDVVETMHKPDEIIENARVGSFYVYERPHMREFIEWVHEHFEVGIWSSATERNTKKLVEYVWGEHLHKVAFIWGQERCSNIGVAPSSTQKHPMFLKELRHVWKMKKNTGLSRFNLTNTLLIDDSPYKAIRNPKFTAIHPRGFTVDDMETDRMLSETGALRDYLERMLKASSVPEFIEANPWDPTGLSEEQKQQIEFATEACQVAREKEKATLDALRDPDEIVLDNMF